MNLRTLGLRKSSPLRADHPGIGQRCVLCKCAIRAGDRTGLVPPLGSEETALADGLICHWTCIESGLSRLRQGETAAGTTRRFLESWADAFNRQAVAGERCDAYTSEAAFILKNGRSFEYAALPRGVRWGDRANASATPRHWRFGSLTSTCTWRVTPSTGGLPCARWRTPGASTRTTSLSIRRGMKAPNTSAYPSDTTICAGC